MTVFAGSRLGPYEIASALGAGGMGEVYRARDTKLNRDVALKVLPEAFTHDPDRLARFKREAQVLASLNHPHIGAIYGFEDSGETHALVLELVEGDTLADRIARGLIPLDEALTIARQICEALEAAHEQGIIHRDLKPSNIKITPEGVVKVLDFGLAKLGHPEVTPGHADVTASPTITSPAMMTGIGVILGTAAYMSPEQAKGRPADKRSDIWAFGAVLYEMLTGRRAFAGDDAPDTLAAVLRGEPDWSTLPSEMPTRVRSIINGCFQKDRKKRIPDFATIRFLMTADAEVSAGPPASSNSRRRMLIVGAAAFGIGAAIAAAITLAIQRTPPTNASPIRFTVSASPNTSFGAGNARPTMSLSPDGRHLALVLTDQSAGSRLWVRTFDSLAFRALNGTEGATRPFWSPDSRFIGFFADGKLKKIAASDGPTTTLCDFVSPEGAQSLGGTWSRAGIIVFGPAADGGLLQVSAAGGQPKAATSSDPSHPRAIHRFPQFLPDDRRFLYVNQDSSDQIIVAGSLDSMDAKRVIERASMPFYSPPGYLVFVRQGTITIQRFDAARLEVSGEAFPFAENVALAPSSGFASLTVSDSGILAFRPVTVLGQSQLTWFERTGRRLGTVGESAPYLQLALSPDGKQIAVQRNQIGSLSELWLLDALRGVSRRLTSNSGDAGATWSPDGGEVGYFSLTRGLAIFHKSTNGPEQEFQKGAAGILEDWAQDYLIYLSNNDVWAMSLSNERKTVRVTETAAIEDEPQLSPDGRWIAYYNNELGSPEIYVQSFPERGVRERISTSGGNQPKWRADGKELFYLTPDGSLMAVELKFEPALEVRTPKVLFKTPLNAVSSVSDQYSVTPDGQRFLILSPAGETAESPITVVVNWLEELKQRVPVK